MKIVHIINPVNVGRTSDLFVAQPVTFESMRRAKDFANNQVEVNLVTTQYPEDHEIIPSYFNKAADLERSVMDITPFNKTRKLPLIRDILSRALESSKDAEYIVYTNVDIALLPHFYLFVKDKINSGLDAFIINRRTISNEYTLETLTLAYSDIGIEHPGFDCFVLRKELVESLNLGAVCIGANWIGRTMFVNLISKCAKYEVFKNEHLTFHIGEDGAWLLSDFSEFDKHNKMQLYGIIDQLLNDSTDHKETTNLKAVRSFMDNYGLKIVVEDQAYSPSRWTKLKKNIKKILKSLSDKNS